MGLGTKIKGAFHNDKNHHQTASSPTTSRPQKAPGAYPESVTNIPRTAHNDTMYQSDVADKPLPEIEREDSLDLDMGDYIHTTHTQKMPTAHHPKNSNLVAEAEAMDAKHAGIGDVRDNKSHPYWGDVEAKNGHARNKTVQEPNFSTFADDHTVMPMNRAEKNQRGAANEPINHINHDSRQLDNDASMMHHRNVDGNIANNGLHFEEPYMTNNMNNMNTVPRSEEPFRNNMNTAARSDEPFRANNMNTAMRSDEPFRSNNMNNVPRTEESFRGNNMTGFNAPMGSINRGNAYHNESIGGRAEDPAFGHSNRYDDSYSRNQSDMRFAQNQSPSMVPREDVRGFRNGAHHNGMGAAGAAAGAMGAAGAMERGHHSSVSGSDHSGGSLSNKVMGSDHYGPGHSGAKVMHQCQHCGHDNDISKYFSKDVIYRMS